MSDDVERHTFTEMPSERTVWQAWFRSHGVYPGDVLIPGWVERRPQARQIAFEGFDLDLAGRPRMTEDRSDFRTETRVVQLGHPPGQFPPTVT